MNTTPDSRIRRRRRHVRRARRQEGAVLFVVLMVVAMSSLAATFAVQDTAFELKGTRGNMQALAARYVAEAGVNTVPAVVDQFNSNTFHALLASNGQNDRAAFPSSRFNVPTPSSPLFWPADSDDLSARAFPAAVQGGTEPVLQDSASPYTSRYEVLFEGICNGDQNLSVTASVYGRQTLGWNPATGAYDSSDGFQQAGDPNYYHDTVSISRSYYMMPNVTDCPGQ